jgi:hypothetical protein
LIVFVNVLERFFVMEETIKMKYVAPEIVDFKWIGTLGACETTGSSDTYCKNGNVATGGTWGCYFGATADAIWGTGCWNGGKATGTNYGCDDGIIPTPPNS